MQNRYDSFIFDLDGTLCDTLPDIREACNYALQSFSLPTRELSEFPSFVGEGSIVMLKRALKDIILKDDEFKKLYDIYHHYYMTHSVVKTKAYKGMQEVLDKAKKANIKLFVYTNKPDDLAVEVINFCFKKNTFDKVVGIPYKGKTKPAPDTFLKETSSFDIDYSRFCYFGDSTTDIETAYNLHIPNIYSVLWGYSTKEQLSSFSLKATKQLERVDEIGEMVC